jgi:hypothetical protein
MLERDDPELLGISYSNLFHKRVSPSRRKLAIDRWINGGYAEPLSSRSDIGLATGFEGIEEIGAARPRIEARHCSQPSTIYPPGVVVDVY